MSALEQRHISSGQPPAEGQLREYLCKLEPMRIPRPKCSGMEFVQTSGRQGFYLSLRRKETKTAHTPLSALTFQPPSPPTAAPATNGDQGNSHFEHRLNEAASNLSLTGNGRHVIDQAKNGGRPSMAKMSA